MEKILLISDGIIFIVVAGEGELDLQTENVGISVAEYGAEIQISNKTICLPASVLAHLEGSDGTNIYFYESEPYLLVAEYKGRIELNRDEILKVKGAWEYQAPRQDNL